MKQIKLLNEQQLRQCVSLDGDLVDCIERCFHSLATEAVVMPPIMSLEIAEHHGEVDVKTAYLPGNDSFVVKMSSGFFDNHKLGLPNSDGLMVMLSARTGQVEALLLDNGYLTDVRTAAAGAVAAKWLSRENARSVAILGAGLQARLQLEATMLVRDLAVAHVWARDPQRAETFAEDMSTKTGIDVNVHDNAAAAVRDADIVVTTTPSREPLLHAADLHPGQHVTAMGSDAEHKHELAVDVLERADVYVCDRLAQVRVLGELRHAIDAGCFPPERPFPELGQVIAGQESGRVSPEQLTVCDLTGTGAQDTAIANLVNRRATEAGLGTTFES